MTPEWRAERLLDLVCALATRPRHEALRGQVTELLRAGFGAPYSEIAHEVHLLDGTGQIDTLWGATVIDLKSDLRRELPDVHARLPDYLRDAAKRARSPRPVTGLVTDGATFLAYTLRDGALQEVASYKTDPARPGELMAWLEPLLTDRPDLLPEPRGEVGARHFDNLVWTLPTPEYGPADALHRDLAAAAARAEAVAADGVAAEMEALVDALLPP